MKKNTGFKIIRNLLFSIALIIITFWLLFREKDIGELISIVRSANGTFVLLGIGLMFLFFLTEAYNVRSILYLLNEKISVLKALKFTFIGFFFSSITPAATGGQPLEIYYMRKDGILGANATMALLIQLCGYQISTILLGIVCAILSPSILQGGFIWLFLLGLTINGFALSIMIICIFSKKLTKKIINIFINILKFLRIKNLDEKKQEIEKGLENTMKVQFL